ncbi:MAG: hypothetical protein UCJ13_00425, partial [Bacteroidaceae bacterium]|nr:hypothetical protein [Bacteroidaceae bacterium]
MTQMRQISADFLFSLITHNSLLTTQSSPPIMTDFRLVKATPEDAPQVALIMAEALGDDIME